MQERHQNRSLYFEEQGYTTKKYVIPFINDYLPIDSNATILEIGCGEGGNLMPFLDLNCKCIGIDLNQKKIELGHILFEKHPNNSNLELICADIYEIDAKTMNVQQFDLILLRDVVEHIHNQEKLMEFMKRFLKPNGKIFFAFPPWYNPFGGHQQIAKSKISLVPFVHLLPKRIYKSVLKFFEGDNILEETNTVIVEELMNIKETGISIEKFRKILKKSNYEINKEVLYFINPNYEIKFKLKPRELFHIFKIIPFFRNFYTTAVYCIVSCK